MILKRIPVRVFGDGSYSSFTNRDRQRDKTLDIQKMKKNISTARQTFQKPSEPDT